MATAIVPPRSVLRFIDHPHMSRFLVVYWMNKADITMKKRHVRFCACSKLMRNGEAASAAPAPTVVKTATGNRSGLGRLLDHASPLKYSYFIWLASFRF